MPTRRTTSSPTASIAIALILLGSAPSSRGEDQRTETPSISVTGTGKISAMPDVADITLGVVTQAPAAKDASAANNEAMTRLHGVLKEHGVATKDIQTSQLQITPQYSQPQPQVLAPGATPVPQPSPPEFIPRIVGYRVENTVRIVSRQIDKLGPLLDTAVRGGANQISGISFRVDHPERLFDEARKRAMADAKRRAELLAGEAGVVLGHPLRIQEQSDSSIGGELLVGRGMPVGGFEPTPSMPVAPGELNLFTTVSVVYELKIAK
jgi:uncharacterized protein YggE